MKEVDWLVALMQLDELSQAEERADWMERPVALDPDDGVEGPTQKKSGKSPSCSAADPPVRSFKSKTP